MMPRIDTACVNCGGDKCVMICEGREVCLICGHDQSRPTCREEVQWKSSDGSSTPL